MIVVPIVASAGFLIPKSSSRAITTPAGTADAMEVLAKVTFTENQIYKIVEKTNGCIVWGGGFKIAPADDEIIQVEEPLALESYDKILVSVMAKKLHLAQIM
jgi:AMP phosphorylase